MKDICFTPARELARVTVVLEKQRKVFTDLGCIVEEAEPDFSGATDAFEQRTKAWQQRPPIAIA